MVSRSGHDALPGQPAQYGYLADGEHRRGLSDLCAGDGGDCARRAGISGAAGIEGGEVALLYCAVVYRRVDDLRPDLVPRLFSRGRIDGAIRAKGRDGNADLQSDICLLPRLAAL